MTITQVLEHPWIIGKDQVIQKMRRKSMDSSDKVLQFVAFSNTDMAAMKKNSPKASMEGKFDFSD